MLLINEDWMVGNQFKVNKYKIHIKMFPYKRKFIGTFAFYSFEPEFRMIFPHSSGFKRTMNRADNNFPIFEPWRREDHSKCQFKGIKRKVSNIFSFVGNHLFIYPWDDCLRFNHHFYIYHARMSALIDISHQFGVPLRSRKK